MGSFEKSAFLPPSIDSNGTALDRFYYVKQEKASKHRKSGKNEKNPSTSKEKSPKLENTNKTEPKTKGTYIDIEKETNSKIITNGKSSKTVKNKLQVPKESKKKGKINKNSKSEIERVSGVKRSRRRVSDVNYKEREDDDGDDDDDDDVKKGGVSLAASDVMEISSTNRLIDYYYVMIQTKGCSISVYLGDCNLF